MKKTLSIILAVVMALTACACTFGVFAAGGSNDALVCECENCTKIANGCHCCAACPYLDETYLLSCAKDQIGHFKGSFCCSECTGIWPCDCTCGCEACSVKDDRPDDDFTPIFTETQQKEIVNGFQAIMKKIASVFDNIFNAIFAFLRFGELFG